jgi:hypothetical protein
VDPTEFYPHNVSNFTALEGANDVATYIKSPVNNGAIGYAEYYYAKVEGIPSVSMLNAAGYFVQPTASNVAIALEDATINPDANSPDYLMQTLNNVYTDPDPRAYPLSSYSYLIVPRTSRVQDGESLHPFPSFTTAKGQTLSTYVNYILCQAQQSSAQLGYSPLPGVMVNGGFEEEKYIPGAVKSPAANNYAGAGCNNPAYTNGKDLLTAEAPEPTACQKYGAPLDCVLSDGKAKPAGSTNNSNSSGNGSNSSGNGSNSSGNGSNSSGNNSSSSGNNSNSPGNKSGPGSTESINPNTGQVESSTGQATSNVSAEPTGLASQPAEQWLFGVLTAILLLAVIAVPAGLGTWLQRTPRRRGR